MDYKSKVSITGIILGKLFLLGFYNYAFVMLGIFGYFFVFFSTGNQFAIYSDVCVPELRGPINSLNGVMLNIGGIVGSIIVSSIIQINIFLISVAITVVLIICLVSSLFWVISYFYYFKDRNIKKMVMLERRKELEVTQQLKSKLF